MDTDNEIEAIHQILQSVKGLTFVEAKRVLKYCCDRVDDAEIKPQIQSAQRTRKEPS